MPRFRNRREQDRRGLDDTSRTTGTEPWREVDSLRNARHAGMGMTGMRRRAYWDPNAPSDGRRGILPPWAGGIVVIGGMFLALLLVFFGPGPTVRGMEGGLEVLLLFPLFIGIGVAVVALVVGKVLALSLILSLPGRALRRARGRRGAR